jgi:hypothetical protein
MTWRKRAEGAETRSFMFPARWWPSFRVLDIAGAGRMDEGVKFLKGEEMGARRDGEKERNIGAEGL